MTKEEALQLKPGDKFYTIFGSQTVDRVFINFVDPRDVRIYIRSNLYWRPEQVEISRFAMLVYEKLGLTS